MKTLEQKLIDFSNGDAAYAKRLYKVLEYHGIDSIDILKKMTTESIYHMKGIGDKGMAIIGRMLTAEEGIPKKVKEKPMKKDGTVPMTLHDWFQKAGANRLESYNLEKILKQNGVSTMDIFMDMGQKDFAAMPRIAAKRLDYILEAKRLILLSRGKAKSKK